MVNVLPFSSLMVADLKTGLPMTYSSVPGHTEYRPKALSTYQDEVCPWSSSPG